VRAAVRRDGVMGAAARSGDVVRAPARPEGVRATAPSAADETAGKGTRQRDREAA